MGGNHLPAMRSEPGAFHLPLWGASSSGEKSGIEEAMFEYRLKAMRVWPPAALFARRRGVVAPSGSLLCLLSWRDKKGGRLPAGEVKLLLPLTLTLSPCSCSCS